MRLESKGQEYHHYWYIFQGRTWLLAYLQDLAEYIERFWEYFPDRQSSFVNTGIRQDSFPVLARFPEELHEFL